MNSDILYGRLFLVFLIILQFNSCTCQHIANGDDVNHSKSILELLKEQNHLPISKRITLYNSIKDKSVDFINPKNEADLNLYGYSLLWDQKIKEAIEIFKLVVAEYPNSANAYDSLGEAFLANGNNQLSLLNYKIALKLDPSNFNAEDQIEMIQYPNKKPQTPAQKFSKIYTVKEYQEDLQQFGDKLLEVHPNALKFISKEDFWNLINNKKKAITPQTTYSQFVWHCNEIISSVNCSHTSLGRFREENKMVPLSLRFPLQTRLIDNQLFVINPLNNNLQITKKSEIISINGIPVTDIILDIYKHTPSQGYIETSKRHYFNTWSTALIPFALNFPKKYEIKIKGQSKPIKLKPAQKYYDPIGDQSIDICEDDLCFEILDNTKGAVLTISSFNFYRWNNFTVFEDFINNTFTKINQSGIENLIIDVRFNGGGSPESSIHLLKYLTSKPFKYYSNVAFDNKVEKVEGEDYQTPFNNAYKGELFFIIDGNGNSTTGHFMAIAKDLKLGIIVGEELGSNQFCSAGQIICRLSNTKTKYYVANNTYESSTSSFSDEIGILPDHFVTQGIDDYINKVDVVKQFTLALFSK